MRTLSREEHIRVGKYLKDIVFAANDGIVTTFAVIAGVAGAALSPTIVVIVGFANVLADGLSMATGNYLGTKSEKEFYKREEELEKREVKEIREKEIDEVRQILIKKGFEGNDLTEMLRLITNNYQYFIDFMMHEELGLFSPPEDSPVRHAAATFIAFALAGTSPLLPYLFGSENAFALSCMIGAILLFTIGACRTFFSGKSWFLSGIEMFFVGGAAAIAAYGVGVLFKALGV